MVEAHDGLRAGLSAGRRVPLLWGEGLEREVEQERMGGN